MAVELKEILQTIGLDKDAEKVTIDEIRNHVGATFISRANAEKDEELKAKLTGGAFGKITTKVKDLFELSNDETFEKDTTGAATKNKSIEDILAGVKKKYDARITDLETKSKAGNDEKVQSLTEELGQYKLKLEAKEHGIQELTNKYTTESKEWNGKLTSYKLNDKLGKVRESVKDRLADDYHKNELVKTGFEASLDSKYAFELDDADEIIVKSKADGKIVMSKTAPTNYAKPDEIILLLAEEKNVLKKNNGKGTGKEKPAIFIPTKDNEKSKVHPKALLAAQRTID